MTAPTSMIPSIPRFSTPARSFSSAPSAASAIGVPVMTAPARVRTSTESFTLPPPRPSAPTATGSAGGPRDAGSGGSGRTAHRRARTAGSAPVSVVEMATGTFWPGRLCSAGPGVQDAAEQHPDRHDGERVVARQRRHDDPVVAEVEHQPVGVEPPGTARHLTGTGQARERARQQQDHHDDLARRDAGVTGRLGRVAEHPPLEPPPGPRDDARDHRRGHDRHDQARGARGWSPSAGTAASAGIGAPRGKVGEFGSRHGVLAPKMRYCSSDSAT